MSEIRVDTISEKTSANGVAIDGVTIKDGGISATTGSIVFNEASADVDFRVESNGNANAIFVNGGTDSVTIGASGVVQTIAGVPIYSADNSIYIGQDVSGTDSTAQFNTAIGFTTLDAITTGDSNVAIGYNAMTANNTGANNISIGKSALGTNTSGSDNIAIGLDALLNPDTESNNIGIGKTALGGSIAGGEFNVAIGNATLDALTSGDANTAVGHEAGSGITTGVDGTFIGHNAGKLITTGSKNCFVGQNAGDGFDTESHNLGIGSDALGGSIAGGEFNVAVGNFTLDALTSGDKNTAIGYNAGTVLTSANNCTIVGHKAADELTEGNANTAIGDEALTNLTTGVGNTALGAVAGDNLTTGGQSLFIGQDTKASAGGGTYQFVIGHNVTSAGNSTTTIGYDTTEIATNHGSASWAAVSDERYKKDITNSIAGLSFIDDLRTVTFKFKQKNELATDIYGYDANSTDTDGYTDEVAHGFIAQEIKTVLDNHPEIKAGQEIWKQGTDEKSNRQSVSHIGMIPMLVKAIQELSAKVKALEEA